MLLIIARHGIAEDEAPDGQDASRRLTKEGIAQTKKVARGLKEISRRPDVILTSPRVRAFQTAEIYGKAFDRQPEILAVLGEPDPDAILAAVCRRSEETIMLVGHEPTLGRMVQILTAGQVNGCVELKKAGSACIELIAENGEYAGRGALQWLVTPKILKAIG